VDLTQVQRDLRDVRAAFASDRRARQARTALDPADFDRLRDAGLSRAPLPVDRGGLWQDVRRSTRPIAELHRSLAGGDPSVALVASMHPAVLSYWLATPAVPAPDTTAWERQRDAVLDTVEGGAWWGTITSEPGSGGDVANTKAVARRDGDGWRISGQKHFGSGSGMSSFMITTARPEGEEEPDWFYVPVGDLGFDGGAVTITAPWDGVGMRATQSHALAFDEAPAVRLAWPGHLDDLVAAAAPFVGSLFTAVVLGVVETAVSTAAEQLAPRAGSLRPFEQVEWAQAELEAWTAAQAFEGMLRAVESTDDARLAVLRGKTAVAQLGESCLARLAKVVGGGSFSQRSPFAHWFEDVRALGFLRPPWGLAFDGLIAAAGASAGDG
jgi:alkylation response protein AidB-like acyl-CoA dehydrogenase